MASSARPFSEVLQDIAGNIQDIVRAEMRLAKTEVREELAEARSAGALIGIGALAGMLGIFFVLLALVYALSQIMPPWAASSMVAVGLAIIAAVTFSIGIKRFKSIDAAPRTAARLKENVRWAKELTK